MATAVRQAAASGEIDPDRVYLAGRGGEASAVFYTASKIALYRYEVSFQERLRAQLRGMREGIDEMKGLVGRLDAAFDKRSKDLTEEVAAAVRDALAREREVP